MSEGDDQDVAEFCPTEAEKDAARRKVIENEIEEEREEILRVHAGKQPVAAKGRKEPMRRMAEWVDDEPAERPDLGRYFDEFADVGPEISFDERIKICRAYASYLVTISPPKPPAPKRAKKGK